MEMEFFPVSLSADNFESEIVRNVAAATLPCILDGKFFVYLESESTLTKRVGICTVCRPKEVKICGYNNSTSNFVTHLRRRHGEEIFKEYQKYVKEVKKTKQYLKITNCHQSETRHSDDVVRTASLNQFHENILKFFINSMIPLQTIEDPFFKKMFDNLNISSQGLSIISKKTLERLIDDYYVDEIIKIRCELYAAKEVCTTADIFQEKNLNLLVVKAHWLDLNLQRKSRTLACRRFSGSCQYDRISVMLEAVHAEFGLNLQEVLVTITDNSINFVNALNVLGVHFNNCKNPTYSIDENLKSEHSFNDQDFQHAAFIGDIIPRSSILHLPVHLRCSTHQLNLCVTLDANKVLGSNERVIALIHKKVIKKCNNLWNCVSRPDLGEVIHGIVGDALSQQTITGWISLYDGLKEIASIQDQSVQLHLALGLTDILSSNDFIYINEYLRCSKPIAEALKIIEGEEDKYYGILLPCLVCLRKKLQKLDKESLVFCKMLAENYLENFERRFTEYFDFSSSVAQNAAIAAISHPKFKDKWLACIKAENHSRIKSIFEEAVANEMHEAQETFQGAPSKRYDDSFFEFDTISVKIEAPENMQQVQSSKASVIISNYLTDKSQDLSMLNRYPEIKNVFKKYNTPPPSSGPVERFFTYSTVSNFPNTSRLSDEMFEKRMLLKFNLSTP